MFINRNIKKIYENIIRYFSFSFLFYYYYKYNKYFTVHYILRFILVFNLFLQALSPTGILFSFMKYAFMLYRQDKYINNLHYKSQVLEQQYHATVSRDNKEAILLSKAGKCKYQVAILED